jgi:hypothetical protein
MDIVLSIDFFREEFCEIHSASSFLNGTMQNEVQKHLPNIIVAHEGSRNNASKQ